MRWLKYFLIALAFVPFTAQAVTSIPWSITNLTDTFIYPNLVNGSAKGILVSASSTINANLSVSTLTAGNCVQAGAGGILTTIVGACGTSGGSITAVTATNPLFSSGGTTPNISTIFSTTSTFGIGIDGFIYTNHAGLPVTAASSSFFGYTPVPPTRSITVNGTANQVSVTGGTQDLSADRTWTAALTSHTIFPSGGYESPVGSTTNATSTNFAITGAAANCNGINALTTNSTGVVGCTAQPQGTVTAVSVATANGLAGSSSGGATPQLTLTTTITSNVLKGNGTAISGAVNGTDYTLITAKTCTAGDFVSAVTAAGVFTCTTPAGTTYTGTFPITVTGSVISFGGLTTSTPAVSGNIPYFSGVNTFANVATGTISNGTGISVTAGQSVIGSGLTITNTSPLSGLTTAFPLSFSNPALSWIGLATSSALSQGGALYATGVNTIASTPTTTVTCTGSASCTAFTVFGASPVTINATGGSSGTVSTSTNETQGFLAYWTTTSATPALLGKVATSSIGAGTGLTFSGTAGSQVGGTNGTYSVNTTQNITTLSNLTTAGTVNTTAAGLLYSTATSTPTVTSPITYSGMLGNFIGGVSGAFGCASCATFAYPFTPINATSMSTSSGLVITASTTIGNGTQQGGLTISGGATTTLNASFLSSVVIGTSTGALSLLNSNTGNLFLYNTNTSGSSPALVMGGNSGGDTDFWFGRTNNNDAASNDSLQIGAGLVPGTTPVMTWTYQGREGIGSTSPFAKLALHANPTDPAASPMLFAIGSSTATATTTLFTFDNTGNFNLFDRFGSPTVSVNAASTTGPSLAIFATTTSNDIFNAKVCGVAGGVCLFQVDQYGHFAASSTAPTLSSCGTSPSLSSDSSDANGTITVGSVAATACTLTFGAAHTIGTHCVISEQTGSVVNVASYTESLTGFVYSQTGLTSDKLDYICGGI